MILINRVAKFGAAWLLVVGLLGTPGCEKSNELKVERLDPTVGPPQGGHVTIHGEGFQHPGPVGVAVYFGDEKARVSDMKPGEITVRAPSGKAGSKVNVRLVFDNGREFVVKDGYSYAAAAASGLDVDSLTQK